MSRVPGAGAAIPGGYGPAGAHSFTAGLGPAQRGGTGEKGVSLPRPMNPLVLTALGPAGVRSQSQASSRAGCLSHPLSTLDPGGCWPASSPPLWGRCAPCLSYCGHCTSAQEPRHPVHVDSCSSSSSGSVRLHQCLRAPLPGWPPLSLCCLPGWRSHADLSQALPCSPSHPTCCPG